MALKGDRSVLHTDISFIMDEEAERGGVASLSTAGSGAAMDQAAAKVTYAASPSGAKPMGVLMNDMVNVNQTKFHINWNRDEVNKGGKVTLLQKGYVTTNFVLGTPAGGETAFLAGSGKVTPTIGAGGVASTPPVGNFLSTKDEDGYVKLFVDLPYVKNMTN